MLCDRCKNNEACVHISKVQNNGEVQALNLCLPCAFMEFMEGIKHAGIDGGEAAKLQAGLEETLIKKLLESNGLPSLPGLEKLKQTLSPRCGKCHASFGQLLDSGQLGCPDCLDEFRQTLKNNLPPVVLADFETDWSKVPELNPEAECEEELKALRQQLMQAVEREEYEYAADLKKKIRIADIRLKEFGQEASVNGKAHVQKSSEESAAPLDLKQLLKKVDVPLWAGGHPEVKRICKRPLICISSWLSVNRNVAGYPFAGGTASEGLQMKVREYVKANLLKDELFANALVLNGEDVGGMDKEELFNRTICTRDFTEATHPVSIAVAKDLSKTAYINTMDHLSVTFWGKTMELPQMYVQATELDERMAARMPYLRDKDFGIVSRDVGVLGTGIDVGVILHLPALFLFGHLDGIAKGCECFGARFSPLFKRQSGGVLKFTNIMCSGSFFKLEYEFPSGREISRQIKTLLAVARLLEKYELEKREMLRGNHSLKYRCCDVVGKAYGCAGGAFSITCDESREILSTAWLGSELGILENIPIHRIMRALAMLWDDDIPGAPHDIPELMKRLTANANAVQWALKNPNPNLQDMIIG